MDLIFFPNFAIVRDIYVTLNSTLFTEGHVRFTTVPLNL